MEPESISKNLPKSDAVLHASGNLNAKSRVMQIDKNIDKYIEESKQFQISKYFRKGLYLDVKDEFNWCVAQIVEINAEKTIMSIHFDNWSPKYDEELKSTSKKIFPLRFYSEKYTGQRKSTLREFDFGLTKKDTIMERMNGYAKTQFVCTNQDEIQEMYQFICGESYIYLDSLLTCDEKEAKNEAANIVEVVTSFFVMVNEWLKIIPTLVDYYPYMNKYPYLYLVCPEVAILNMAKSFVTTLELIFGYSPRSEDFLKTSSRILNTQSLSPDIKSKKVHLVQAYFIEAFMNTGCLKSLGDYVKAIQTGKSSDFSAVLNLLSSISGTLTKVEITSDDALNFTQIVNSFLFEEGEGIGYKIRSLPAGQVKDLNEAEILTVVRAYYDQSGDKMGKELYCAKTQLDLLLLFLQSPYLDKKLTALNEIKKLFDKKNRSKEVPTKTLAQWLSECSVIEYIYKEAKHPELISRSADLISILAANEKLTIDILQLLWETCVNEVRHEAVTEATLNVIANIAKSLNADMMEYFIEQIHKLSLSMLGEYIGILKTFYLNCLTNFKELYGKARAEKELSKRVNLNLLWEAIQDEADLPNKHKLVTLDVLIELMMIFDLTNTSDFLKNAVDNLKTGKSSIKCMILIEKILDGCQRRGYPPALKKEDLIALAINSADIYLRRAGENLPMDGTRIEDVIFTGSLSHREVIDKYFNFISFLLKKFEGNNKLTNEHIDYMFQVFVKGAISKTEKDCFFKFFTYDEFDLANQDDKRLATGRTREHLFQNILCKELSSENTGTSEFKCFQTNFFYVNNSKKNLKREVNEQVFRTVSLDLQGLDLVWDFAIFSPDEDIRKACSDFLGDLYLYNEKDNYKKRGDTNSLFIEAWLEKILTIDESNQAAIANILRLLFNFVKRYDGHHMDSEVFEKYDTNLEVEMQDCPKSKPKRSIFKVNKDMTIGAIRKRVGDFYDIIPSEILIISSRSYLTECCMNDKLSAYKECRNINVRRRTKDEKEQELPRYLVSANLNLLKQVIEKGLQSNNHALRCESLQFLEYLPPNSDRRNKMIQCKKLSKSNDIEAWKAFLYCNDLNSQGIYYGLKIMKSILVPTEKHMSNAEIDVFDEEKDQFFKRLIDSDGFTLLCNTFKKLDITNIVKDVVWLSVFQMLTSILELMMEDKRFLQTIPKQKEDDFLKSTRILILQTTEILTAASANVKLDRDLSQHLFTPEEAKLLSEDKVKNIKEEYEILETDFFYYLIELLDNCLKFSPSEFEVFYSSDFIRNGVVVRLLASHPNAQTMRRISESIVDFCNTFKHNDTISPNPVHFFIKLLYTELPEILAQPDLKNTEFFNCWNKIIRLVGSREITVDLLNSVEVAKALHKTVVTRNVVEDDTVQDSILAGCLLMLTTLDELFHSDLKTGCPSLYSQEFLKFLLYNGLFSRERPDSKNDSFSFPLCKHSLTRKYALQLLAQIFGETHMNEIAKFLEPYIKNGSWRTNKREKWSIQSTKLSQRTTHVGLVNLGCTCYMNSLMQQLFMSPYFRNFICCAIDQKRDSMPLEDNVLYHSKYLFANLLKTKMPTYNPINFFNSIKDYTGEPMPTNEQRDVDEFLNIYMDKIEQNILNSPDMSHLKSIFGGAFAQELICKD